MAAWTQQRPRRSGKQRRNCFRWAPTALASVSQVLTMLSMQQLSLSYAPAAALTTPRTVPRSVPKMETVQRRTHRSSPIPTPALCARSPHAPWSVLIPLPSLARQAADLESLAKQLNPTVGFYDPLGFAKSGMGEAGTLASEEAVIGFLRQAEIKHGRVAMAAFVGFIVQSNGIHFPWDLTTSGISHADIAAAGGPAAQWDALPTASKLQVPRLGASPQPRPSLAPASPRRLRRGGVARAPAAWRSRVASPLEAAG